MSEMERNVGILRKFKLDEEIVRRLVPKLPRYYRDDPEGSYSNEVDWEDLFYCAVEEGLTSHKFIFANEEWYQILEHKRPEATDSYANVTRLENGNFSFDTFHYNGGAHWTEMIEEGILGMRRREMGLEE